MPSADHTDTWRWGPRPLTHLCPASPWCWLCPGTDSVQQHRGGCSGQGALGVFKDQQRPGFLERTELEPRWG